MNLAKLIMIVLHSNTFCQLLLWSYKGKKRENLKKQYRLSNFNTFWMVWDYFIGKKDRVTTMSNKYPNIFELICI